MAQLTVRNLDDAVVAALKAQAERHGRSAEAEHRRILQEALLGGGGQGDFFAAAAALRARIGPMPADALDSTTIIRADRDRADTAE